MSGAAGAAGPAGPAGASVTGVGIASNNLFTGNGTTTIYAIGSNVSNVRDVMVSVEGMLQVPTTDYTSVSYTHLTLPTNREV